MCCIGYHMALFVGFCYLFYIRNNSSSSIVYSKPVIFADDTTVYCPDNSPKGVFEYMNKDWDLLSD